MRRSYKVLLFVLICMLFAGCNKITTPAYVTEGKDALKSDDVCSGEFYMYGETYQFPMMLSDFLESGWHISNNVKNKDTFELDPGFVSTEFNCFKDDDNKKYFKAKVTNLNDTPAKLADCMVTELTVYVKEYETVFPGGAYSMMKSKQFLELHPDYDDKREEFTNVYYSYKYETRDDWKCVVEFEFSDIDRSASFYSATFTLEDSDQNFDKIDSTTINADGIRKYLEAYMAVYYHGDIVGFKNSGYGTIDDGQQYHKSELAYSGGLVAYYLGIDTNYVTDETMQKINNMAGDILNRSKWEILDIIYDPATQTGSYTIALKPSNFFDKCDASLDRAYNKYLEKYPDAVYSTSSEEMKKELMDYYAVCIADATWSERNTSRAIDGPTFTFDFDYAQGITTADVWDQISLTLLGLYYEAEEN